MLTKAERFRQTHWPQPDPNWTCDIGPAMKYEHELTKRVLLANPDIHDIKVLEAEIERTRERDKTLFALKENPPKPRKPRDWSVFWAVVIAVTASAVLKNVFGG